MKKKIVYSIKMNPINSAEVLCTIKDGKLVMYDLEKQKVKT